MKLIPTILSGGSGSRLWPVSRELEPKPFIRLADGQSFLQKSFLRASALENAREILTVTNRNLAFKTKDDYQELNQRIATSYLLEPEGRNTAAAVTMAALYVAEHHGEEAILLVLTADHLIEDQNAFAQAVENACAVASTGKIVTFGIPPETPETGYGYIEADTTQAIHHDNQAVAYPVAQFVEKPDLATAQHYVDSGKYYWNSGMFCFTAGSMIRELETHAKDILEQAQACYKTSASKQMTQADGQQIQIELDANTFANIHNTSIDYAVMEKSKAVAVVPCNIGWNDIGAWDAMSLLTDADAETNRVQGDAVNINSQNCYIHGHTRLIATVGLDNIIIIDTPDALLVANKSNVQQVKEVYNKLKQQGHESYKLHQTVHRPWGTYTTLREGGRYKIKSIIVKPNQRLSLQMHHHRSEHWVVVSGMAKVTNGDQTFFVNTNESTYIPAGHNHRLENPGIVDLEIIEVQSGEYLGEDDIVRFEDNYGRLS